MRKLKRVVVKEELVALTGRVDHAIVLNQFIYWSERVKDVDNYLKEEMERIRQFSDGSIENEEDIKANLANGWIYKTASQMKEECMFEKSETTMKRIINDLVNAGWLSRRKNPKYKWDKTYQYRVNIFKIQRDLNKLGYALEGYSLLNENPDKSDNISDKSNDDNGKKINEPSKVQNEPSKVQNEPSKVQNELSKVQNEPLKVQNGRAIPEITTDITPDITSNVCEEKIQQLIKNRKDLQAHTHDILHILNRVKNKDNFRCDIFLDTLKIIDFDVYDISYFKSALSQNLKKGYVKPYQANMKYTEKLPEWMNNEQQLMDTYNRLKKLKETEEMILKELNQKKELSQPSLVSYEKSLKQIRQSIKSIKTELNNM